LDRVFLQLLFAWPVPQLEQATFVASTLSVNAIMAVGWMECQCNMNFNHE
jgi:hypothetical protein